MKQQWIECGECEGVGEKILGDGRNCNCMRCRNPADPDGPGLGYLTLREIKAAKQYYTWQRNTGKKSETECNRALARLDKDALEISTQEPSEPPMRKSLFSETQPASRTPVSGTEYVINSMTAFLTDGRRHRNEDRIKHWLDCLLRGSPLEQLRK